jgi:SAM-dependent methyltransferase
MERLSREILERMASRLPDEERDEMAIPSYLHPNPALRFMAWRRVEVIADSFSQWFSRRPKQDETAVLDFGCGTGVLFREALRFADKIYGVDIVLAAARLMVEELDLENVELLDPADVPDTVADSSIDAVLAAEVLEHFEDLTEPLTMFQRVLKPDGRLFVSVPTENALYKFGRRLAGFKGDYHHSNASSIDGNIQKFGYRLVRTRYVPAPGPLSIYWVLEYEPPRG